MSELVYKLQKYLEQFNKQHFDTQFTLRRIYSATVQIVAGKKYVLMVDLDEDGTRVKCKVTLWEQAWKNFARLQLECGDGSRKYSFTTKYIGAPTSSSEEDSDDVDGGEERITDKKKLNTLTRKLQNYLTRANEQHFGVKFRLIGIRSATHQIVEGDSYEFIVDLMKNQQQVTCKVKLWEKAWENYAELEIGDGPEKYSFTTDYIEDQEHWLR